MGDDKDLKFPDLGTFLTQPEEQLKMCLPLIEAIPIACTPENAQKTKGQAEKCMTQYIGPAAACLDRIMPATQRQNWTVDLPKYFAPYYKLMPLIYNRLKELPISPFAARNFTSAINGLYLASVAQGKPEIITDIAKVLENLANAKIGTLETAINYVQNTKISDIAPEFPPVELTNKPAIMLYVWAGKFAWPDKREPQLLNEALWLFPPKPLRINPEL